MTDQAPLTVARNPKEIFSSTVITTIGRPSLARSVESVLSQRDVPAEFEVIVVNDSGCPLPPEDWQHSERVTILETHRRERCVARNSGAAIARGAYLHFLDDDDWLLPGALKELQAVAFASNAAWIYGTSRLVDKDGNLLMDLHIEADGNAFVQVMNGQWLPLQSSLIRTECFFEAGGFDLRLTVCQGIDLSRRVALRGDLASTRVPVVCIMRDRQRSTTAPERITPFSVWSRDNILDEKGSFARMLGSAKTSFWRGRLVRGYLTCVVWNLSKGKILRATGRACGAGATFVLSAPYALSSEFWRALVRSYSITKVA